MTHELKNMKQIPNLFTLLNLVFGCISIVFVTKYNYTASKFDLSIIWLQLGCYCLFVSAVVDFFDGFVARLFKATSAMGEQLDSLADAVSFGVAPAVILYKLLEISYQKNTSFSGEIFWVAVPSFIFACAAVWRLAKFNLDKEQTYYFKGVPTPAAALVVASLPLSPIVAGSAIQTPMYLYAIIILLSFLMVSNIPLISLKFKSFDIKKNVDKIILLLIAIVAVIFLKWAAVPIIFISYVVLSLFFKPNKNLL
jgi:CDP-diacylglycerol---serine O-phosphatidyltransferase